MRFRQGEWPYAGSRGPGVRRRVTLLAMLGGLALASHAQAAGIYYSDRGVRPMGRAGAFVAGADDASAVWYNPAGLADAKSSLLIDAAWLRFRASYERTLEVVDADGTVRRITSPSVEGESAFLPIPTIAGSYRIDAAWTLGVALFSPYPASPSYPPTVEGQPSPARYSSASFDGSALAFGGVYVAYQPAPAWRFGAGLGVFGGIYQTELVLSASPDDRVLGAPEQPEFDTAARLRVAPIVAPTGNLGAIWQPVPLVRVGLSAQAPALVDAPATVQLRLPNHVAFDGATVAGGEAGVRFVLPPIVRLGVELRPVPELRVELAYVREFWSMHDAIVATPKDLAVQGVAGLPERIEVPKIVLPRGFVDSNALRLGGEARITLGAVALDLRLGGAYETSAVPTPFVSLLGLDSGKWVASAGLGVHVGAGFRVDATWAHFIPSSVDVPPEAARVPRTNALRGTAQPEYVNGGQYQMAADLVGLGLAKTF